MLAALVVDEAARARAGCLRALRDRLRRVGQSGLETDGARELAAALERARVRARAAVLLLLWLLLLLLPRLGRRAALAAGHDRRGAVRQPAPRRAHAVCAGTGQPRTQRRASA